MPTVASTLEEGNSQKEQGRKTEDLENEEKTENEIEKPKTKPEVNQQKTTENNKVQSSNAVNDASDEDEDQNKVG